MKNYTNKEIADLLNIDINKAKEIKKVCNCKDNAILMTYKDVNNWVKQCYNLPSLTELKLCALNEILSGYGVESIDNDNVYINHYYMNCCANYVNMGDTYIMTILQDNISGKFLLCSWGDYYEKYLMKYDNN